MAKAKSSKRAATKADPTSSNGSVIVPESAPSAITIQQQNVTVNGNHTVVVSGTPPSNAITAGTSSESDDELDPPPPPATFSIKRLKADSEKETSKIISKSLKRQFTIRMPTSAISKYVANDARTLELIQIIVKSLLSKKPLSYEMLLKEHAVLEAITRSFPLEQTGSTAQNIKLFAYIIISSISNQDPSVDVNPLVQSVELFQGARGKSLIGERTFERIKSFADCLEAFREG
jgi:hypothetical protein